MGIRMACAVPGDDHVPHIDILRLPPSGSIRAVILSPAPFECMTHWIENRTLPCVGEDCPCRERELATRYNGWLAISNRATRKRAIIVLSERAVLQLKAGIPPGASMRGRVVDFKRRGDKPNGAIVVEYCEEFYGDEHLGKPVQLERHLASIWRIDNTQIGDDFRAYAAAINRLAGANDDIPGDDSPESIRVA